MERYDLTRDAKVESLKNRKALVIQAAILEMSAACKYMTANRYEEEIGHLQFGFNNAPSNGRCHGPARNE